MEQSKKVLDILFRFDVTDVDATDISKIQEDIITKKPTEEILQDLKGLVEEGKFKTMQSIKDFYVV